MVNIGGLLPSRVLHIEGKINEIIQLHQLTQLVLHMLHDLKHWNQNVPMVWFYIILWLFKDRVMAKC